MGHYFKTILRLSLGSFGHPLQEKNSEPWLHTAASLGVHVPCCQHGCPREPWKQSCRGFYVSDLSAISNLGYRQVCVVPLGNPRTVARVYIGQVIMSIFIKLQNKEHFLKARCRAKFKFPGCQKFHTSKKTHVSLSLMQMNLKTW